MKHVFEIAMPILLTFLLVSPLYAHAPGDPPIVFQPVINFDLQGLIDSFNSGAGTITGAVGAVPQGMLGLFKGYLEDSARGMDVELLAFLKTIATSNPDPESMRGISDSVSLIISGFYLLTFLWAGMQFMLAGFSAEKRHAAKGTLGNAIAMVVAVGLAFPAYSLLLELASAVSLFAISSVPESFFLPSALTGLGIGQLVLFALCAAFAIATLFLRHISLLIGAGLFPVAIFLYFPPPLRPWGSAILNMVGAAIAMQFVTLLGFWAAANMLSGFAPGIAGWIIPAFAFIAVGAGNISLALYALAKSALSPIALIRANPTPANVPTAQYHFAAPAQHTQQTAFAQNPELAQAMERLCENINTLSGILSAISNNPGIRQQGLK